jgi:hypothetical protein
MKKDTAADKAHLLVQGSYVNVGIGLIMLVVGIAQMLSELNDSVPGPISQKFQALTIYGAAHFTYSLSYLFRGATYIDKWALLHTWTGLRGTALAGLHLLTEDPRVNIVAGVVMVLAGLPDTWVSLTDDLPGFAHPASMAMVAYGIFNLLKCLIPIFLGITYLQKGGLIKKRPQGPPA